MDPEQAELELGEESGAESDLVNASEDDLEVGSGQEGEAEAKPAPAPEPRPDPNAKLQAQLAEEREARIRLEERLRAQEERSAPRKEPPKTFTRAQLRAAVNEGTIDEDQMEEIWATQEREKIKREVEDSLTRRDQQRETDSFIREETTKYTAQYPELLDTNSETWRKVKREYDFLVRTGDPDSKATELKALRAALGSADRVRESTARHRETSRETSGSASGGGDRPVDIWNRVPKKYREYYKQQVREGRKTLEDVKKDLPYMDTTQ